jgi:hypothetical protein
VERLIQEVFSLSQSIRYVAIYRNGQLTSASKPDTQGASSSESDKYEELIVNPALLTLAKQRGEIDCGGARFVLVRYGNFYQLVVPTSSGHVSICIEPEANPLDLWNPINALLCKQTIS